MKKAVFKILAIVVLVGILIGISIIKSSLSDRTRASVPDTQLEEYFRTRDSVLLKQFDDTTRFYVDSLLRVEYYFIFQIDSLNDYYQNRESTLIAVHKIDTLIITDPVRIAPQKISTPKKSKEKGDSTASKVRSEFNSIYNRLPKDLTKYEARVSRDEIIVELSKKHKISPNTVKKYIK